MRVIYTVTSLSHKRAFESFMPKSNLDQLIIGPKPIINEGLVPEDYSDFKIKDIKFYQNKHEIQYIINKFNPNIFVEASLPVAKDIKLPINCKKVYVSHGMIGSHVKGIIKKAGFNTSVWKGCDLYCGATNIFSEWVKYVANANDNQILLNALPQLDLLYNSDYYNSFRKKFIKNFDKIILFAGFCCRDRIDFEKHNEDYFATAIALNKLAIKNNWLILIKPRQTHDVIVKFLKNHSWGKKYIKEYSELQNSKNIHFITTSGHIYRYFFADIFIINGSSTIEIEVSAINKPLFIVRTKEDIDPYNTVACGAAHLIKDINNLEILIDYKKYHNTIAQTDLLKQKNINFDGKMHERIQNKLLLL